MLVEMAVADAYALPWEFTNAQNGANDLSTFYQHPTYLELKPGQYTDDTQRSLANALVILSDSSMDKYDPQCYAESYLKVVAQDPREGYSRGYQAFLNSVTNGHDFLTKISREKASNGSLMGVAPLGYLTTIEEVKLASMIQAITTHHQSTVVHAQIVALSAHYFIHVKGSKSTLNEWLTEQLAPGNIDEMFEWSENVVRYRQSYKRTTIAAASISTYMAYALRNYDSLTAIIKDAVDRGGDTDSAAAVAVAVASCCPEIENDIPQHLYDAMDVANPNFGVDYLNRIDTLLHNRYC